MRHALGLLAFASLLLAPLETALACGGFFCSSAPVDQSKEIIVYSYGDDGTLTMAVQVRYQGQDDQFAWILPLPAPPDSITVGTDDLFTALDQQTTPAFVMEQRTEGTCKSEPSCSYPSYGCSLGCAFAEEAPYDRAAFGDAGTGAPDEGLTIYSEAIVGPYDTVVLGASTSAEVIDWLRTNGYDVPPSSEPLLAPYAAEGHVFVALRLTANRVSDMLRPIIVHMPTDEACLPIRLTAIASTPTLPIEAFFLGDRQVRASNYSTAEVELVPELFTYQTSWDEAVAARVRELGGQAFATDYAGAVPGIDVDRQDVTDLASQTDIGAFFQALLQRGYQGNALLLDLFSRFVDPPGGELMRDYANCLAFGTTASCGAPTRFDPAGLAAAIQREIADPSHEAQALVTGHSYLTRLSTTMEPEDMTIDPVFVADDGLPDVDATRMGTLVTECSADFYPGGAPQRLEVNGRTYRVREGRDLTPQEECAMYGGTLSSSGCSATHAGLPLPGLLVMIGIAGAVAYRAHRRSKR